MLKLLQQTGNFGKKILLVIVVYALAFSLFTFFTQKDYTQKENFLEKRRIEIYQSVQDPELLKTSEGRVSVALYRQYACSVFGEVCTNDPKDAPHHYQNSLIGKIANVMTLPFTNPPASGVYWAKDTLENTGFIPKTYAAEGIGFASIKPLLNLWKIIRNLSYMVLVLVLIAIGFMIMFRMKLNPQTVISVENALPKVVVSMILITFSFAIAGFLIDLTYIFIAVGISILSNNNSYFDAGQFQNDYLAAGMTKIGGGFFPKGHIGIDFLMYMGNAFFGLLGPVLNGIIRILSSLFGGLYLGPRIFLPFVQWIAKILHFGASAGALTVDAGIDTGGIAEGPTEGGLLLIAQRIGVIVGAFILPQLAIGIAVLFTIIMTWFRIFFMLFKAYLQILLMVIFSPLFMLMDAIPGQNSFSGWFKGLLGELLTFPITIVLMVTGYVIVNSLTSTSNNLWQPPFIYGANMSSQAYIVLVGMGIMFLIPDLVRVVKEKLGMKPLPISVGLGTFFGGVGAAAGGGMGLVGQFSSISMAFPGLKMALGARAGFLQKAFGLKDNDVESYRSLTRAQEESGKKTH